MIDNLYLRLFFLSFCYFNYPTTMLCDFEVTLCDLKIIHVYTRIREMLALHKDVSLLSEQTLQKCTVWKPVCSAKP
jgi:hypothetical protein